tara:strand:+ start:183 stop:485 length:303 start_codon:yes stop_codon:yes gene_type:complete
MELLNDTNTHFVASHIEDDEIHTSKTYNNFRNAHGTQRNDSVKGVERIIEVVKGEGRAEGREFPRRLALGEDAVREIREKCLEILRGLEEWEDVSGGLGM